MSDMSLITVKIENLYNCSLIRVFFFFSCTGSKAWIKISKERQTNRKTDRQTDGRTDGRTDRQTGERMDGRNGGQTETERQ